MRAAATSGAPELQVLQASQTFGAEVIADLTRTALCDISGACALACAGRLAAGLDSPDSAGPAWLGGRGGGP